MPEHLDLSLGGERLRLYAQRGLYWPARQRLFVSDIHLGKSDLFRRAGIAAPGGSSQDDLARLSTLVERSGATSLWILGDLLHGNGPDSSWRPSWQAFRARHAGLSLMLIDGNHDRAAAGAALGIAHGSEWLQDAPFEFAHAPRPSGTPGPLLRICGHVHPVARIPGFRGRFPVFAMMEGQFVLPAFSAFAGGWLVRPSHAQAMFACLQNQMMVLCDSRAA